MTNFGLKHLSALLAELIVMITIITWLSVAFQEYLSLRELSRMENYGIICTKISHVYVYEAKAH